MLFRGDVGSGHEVSRVYFGVCNIALILACSRTSVCIGFVVGPSTITLVDLLSYRPFSSLGYFRKSCESTWRTCVNLYCVTLTYVRLRSGHMAQEKEGR